MSAAFITQGFPGLSDTMAKATPYPRDLVGYGASPNEVIQRILTLRPMSIIRGNHDKAVSGLDSVQTFNPIAASLWEWLLLRRKPSTYLVAALCLFQR